MHSPSSFSPTLARLVAAGLGTALSDITFANVVAASRRGEWIPGRVFQSVAAGLLGPASFERGGGSAALGALLHTVIAIGWTCLFAFILHRTLRGMRTMESTARLMAIGATYGMCVWLAMNFLVIPLSRARVTPPNVPVFWIMLFGHALFVGLPIAFGVRWAASGAMRYPTLASPHRAGR